MKISKIISAASVVACVLAPFFATAQEYFVATNGDDAADGSAAKPWRTPVFKPHSVVPDSLDKYSCEHGAFVYVNNILGGNPRFKNEVHPSRYEDNWPIPVKYWSVDDATGECRITPPDGSKAPDFKPVDAKRLGKPPFVDQAFPEPTFCKPQLEGIIQ